MYTFPILLKKHSICNTAKIEHAQFIYRYTSRSTDSMNCVCMYVSTMYIHIVCITCGSNMLHVGMLTYIPAWYGCYRTRLYYNVYGFNYIHHATCNVYTICITPTSNATGIHLSGIGCKLIHSRHTTNKN